MVRAMIAKTNAIVPIRGGYATGTAQMPIKEWRKSATRFRQLDNLARRVTDLEKRSQATDPERDEND